MASPFNGDINITTNDGRKLFKKIQNKRYDKMMIDNQDLKQKLAQNDVAIDTAYWIPDGISFI